jgi:hypothetical protein
MTRAEEPDRRSPGGNAAEPAAEGVLGNLPRSRPGIRSPRRAAASERSASVRRAASGHAERATEDEPALGGGLDEVARAGISAAAGAATLGLRIAGRVAGTIRDAVERR